MESTPIYKAGGKVLMAGGYGVLEEGNVGLTLCLSNSFYCQSRSQFGEREEKDVFVRVLSPQIGQQWLYRFDKNTTKIEQVGHILENGLFEEREKIKILGRSTQAQLQSSPLRRNITKNVFVENAVRFTLIYCLGHQNLRYLTLLEVATAFDQGFLSNSTNQQQRFRSYSQGSPKAGLGSSACVVVSIVGSLLLKLLGQNSRKQINVVSQVAHLAAQNKIGSNFDVSTAVFGTHLYYNVIPRKAYLQISQKTSFSELIQLDPKITPLQPLNSNIQTHSRSYLLDMRRGSNTRMMVGSFLAKLNTQYEQVKLKFFKQSKVYTLMLFETLKGTDDQTQLISKLKAINRKYRSFLQECSRITETAVQPSEFTPFLDQLCDLDEVGWVICPGSGGYDAIYLLTIGQQSNIQTYPDTRREDCFKNILKRHGWECEVSQIKVQWHKKQQQRDQEAQQYLQRVFQTYI